MPRLFGSSQFSGCSFISSTISFDAALCGTCSSYGPSVARISFVINRAKSEVAGPLPPSFQAPSI